MIRWLCVLALCGSAWAAEWEPLVYPENQIFPSFIVSTATMKPEDVLANWDTPHLGDENGMIAVSITGVHKGAQIRVEVMKNSFMDGGVFEGVIPKSKDEWIIAPHISYDFSALLKVRQSVPLEVKFAVSVDGKPLGEQAVTVRMHSLNDCLYGVAGETEADNVDFSWLFAAYVNENHPWIDEILRDALKTGIVDSFTGYQSGDKKVVRAQIRAIWQVLEKRGFRYSDISTNDSASETVYSQNVRLFDDAIRARQTNCADGSVLFASILRRIGLDVSLVVLPEHMFLAVAMDDDGKHTIGLETTMIGDAPSAPADPEATPTPRSKGGTGGGFFGGAVSNLNDDAPEARPEKTELQSSFDAAVTEGTSELKEVKEKLADPDQVDYQLISIADARKMGIMPLASGQ